MTIDEYWFTLDDIIDSFKYGELTEAQLEREMEMLQEEYDDNCEGY